MKIGILTLPITENYGGILQAVALSQYLAQEGHDVTLIYKIKSRPLWKEYIRKILKIIPGHNLLNVKKTKKSYKEWEKRRDLHLPFIHKEIPNISPTLKNTQDLSCYVIGQAFDAVIVGSDQVWRKAYINDNYYKSYFLDFIPLKSHIKKIAYAASFGKNYWEGTNDSMEINTLLSDFTAISVREDSGVNICKKTFDIDHVQHVIDPTLLMSKDFYLNLISKYDHSNINSNQLVTYVLDESDMKKEIIQYFQKLQPTEEDITHLRGFNKKNITYSIPEWLYAISQAEFVITDSFHGMVFAIIFEKQFIVIGNEDRGLERFTSLLKKLHLEERLLTQAIDLHKLSSIQPINYELTTQILQKEKESSKTFIHSSISQDV